MGQKQILHYVQNDKIVSLHVKYNMQTSISHAIKRIYRHSLIIDTCSYYLILNAVPIPASQPALPL